MNILFLITLFSIAFLYSSVGHGGASGYLAIMALFGIETLYMKSSALTLNLFVSGISLYNFYKAGFFKWNIITPFILTSVPMAFIGARIHVEPKTYKIILGVFLLLATTRMLFVNPLFFKQKKTVPLIPAMAIGSLLGFFSGIIGIGGGIILSPIIIVLHWADMKEAAAASALFILVNSAVGLLGVYFSQATLIPEILLWVLLAIVGGSLGGHLGSRKFSHNTLRYILSAILILASIKLFRY